MRKPKKAKKQLLHLVFGGRLKNTALVEFSDVEGLDIVGIFPDYASAHDAWRGKAQATIDEADMRYFVVHLHRLMAPEIGEHHHGEDDDD